MTGIEVANRALELYNQREKYAYLYGGKGQQGTEENINAIINAYPSYFKKYSADQIAQIKAFCKGKILFDCSGLVCEVLGIGDLDSGSLIKKCGATTIEDWGMDGKGTAGTLLWKQGHIGINRGDGTFIHIPTELHSIEAGRIADYNWTVCGKYPGIDYSGQAAPAEPDYKAFYNEIKAVMAKY